jgi:hypothetical protein
VRERDHLLVRFVRPAFHDDRVETLGDRIGDGLDARIDGNACRLQERARDAVILGRLLFSRLADLVGLELGPVDRRDADDLALLVDWLLREDRDAENQQERSRDDQCLSKPACSHDLLLAFGFFRLEVGCSEGVSILSFPLPPFTEIAKKGKLKG